MQVIVSGVRLKLSKPAAPTETPPPAPAEKAKPSGQSDGSAGGSGNDKTGIFPMYLLNLLTFEVKDVALVDEVRKDNARDGENAIDMYEVLVL